MICTSFRLLSKNNRFSNDTAYSVRNIFKQINFVYNLQFNLVTEDAKAKEVRNDQELAQSELKSCPGNRNGI